MLVCARLRHVVGTQWGNKKYMNMKYLEVTLEDTSIAGCFHSCQGLQTNLRKTVDSTLHLHRIEGNPPKNNLAIEKGQEILPFFTHLTLKLLKILVPTLHLMILTLLQLVLNDSN